MTCPNLYSFKGVGPGGGGAATFQDRTSIAGVTDGRPDAVGIVGMTACFYNTALARVGGAQVELDLTPYGVIYTVAPTATTVEQIPIFDGLVVGRQTVLFPNPLPVPDSGNGSERRMDLRVLLTGITAATNIWRVFVQTAVHRDGRWHY